LVRTSLAAPSGYVCVGKIILKYTPLLEIESFVQKARFEIVGS
jgi:hypothetical protein